MTYVQHGMPTFTPISRRSLPISYHAAESVALSATSKDKLSTILWNYSKCRQLRGQRDIPPRISCEPDVDPQSSCA